MSDAVRCPACGYVYWTQSYENWATCTGCGRNNDHNWWEKDKPMVVDSKHIFKVIPSDSEVLAVIEDKDLPLYINYEWLTLEGQEAYKKKIKEV